MAAARELVMERTMDRTMDRTTDRTTDRTVQPLGGGGVLGRIGRMIVMVLTAGFVFPNAFIEGMNPTEIDRKFWRD